MSARADTPPWVAGLLATMIALAAYLPGAWGIPFHNLAEPMEALVVREMLETGNWVLPLRNEAEIPSKPPLFHWIAIGFASALGGLDELASRLPSVLAGAATVGLVAAAATAEWGVLAGGLAGLVLFSSPEWVRWSLLARTDAVLCFFLTASILAGERWLRPGSPLWLLAGAVAAGLATLAKGPAALGLVGLILGALLVQRGAWRELRPGWLAAAAVLAAGIPAVWYLLAWERAGDAFVEKQILAENVFRFLPHEGGPSREHGLLAPLGFLLTGTLPWGALLPVALVAARPWRDARRPERSTLVFATIWIGTVLLVCMAASGKRSNYLLPAYPAVALLLAGTGARPLAESLRGERGARAVRAAGWIAGTVVAVIAVVVAAWSLGLEPWRPILPFLHPRDQATLPRVVGALGTPPLWSAALAAAFAAVILVFAVRGRSRGVLGCIAAGLVAVVVLGGLARRVEASLKSLEPFANRVSARVPADEPLWFFREPHYGILFYLPRRAPVAYGPFGEIPDRAWVLVQRRHWEALPGGQRRRGAVLDESRRSSPVHEGKRYLLVRLDAPADPPPSLLGDRSPRSGG